MGPRPVLHRVQDSTETEIWIRMSDNERRFQGDFQSCKDSLSGLRAWKGVVLDDERRNNLHDYRDLGEEISDESESLYQFQTDVVVPYSAVDVLTGFLQDSSVDGNFGFTQRPEND